MPSNHFILYLPLLLPSMFPASGSFPTSWLFISDGQVIVASASASVLPMNIQGWFPLGLTALISLQSKRLSRAFSNTTVQKHQFFSTKALMLGGIEGRRRRGWQRMRRLDGITDSMDVNLSELQSWWWTGRPDVLQFMGLQRLRHNWVTELNWTDIAYLILTF